MIRAIGRARQLIALIVVVSITADKEGVEGEGVGRVAHLERRLSAHVP